MHVTTNLVHFRECPWKSIIELIKLLVSPVILVLELRHTPFSNGLLHLMNPLYADRHWKEGLTIYLATHFIHNVLQLIYVFHDIIIDNSWPVTLIFWIRQQWLFNKERVNKLFFTLLINKISGSLI